MKVRPPAAAGTFYPKDREALRKALKELLPDSKAPKQHAMAILVPHAGYAWSGPVAAKVFSRLQIPEVVVLLSFSHLGRGADFAVWPAGAWRTPLGDVPVNEMWVRALKACWPDLKEDEECFLGEHSGEVQLPFLQYGRRDVQIVPVSVNAWRGDPDVAERLQRFGEALARAGTPMVVATTDLTHCGAGYGAGPPPGLTPDDFAREQDYMILEPIERLNLKRFFEVLLGRGVSMCGVAPTAVFMAFGKTMGFKKAERLAYATSAENEPGADRAVGYPGLVLW